MPAEVILTDEQKKAAIQYVQLSGLYMLRLAKFLRISYPTLQKIFKEDQTFFKEIEAAEADFIQNVVKAVHEKRPDFILKSKYADEFPDRLQVEHSGKLSFTEFIQSENLDGSTNDDQSK